MLARLFRAFLAAFVSLFVMWFVSVLYFFTMSIIFPLSNVSNFEALVIFGAGVAVTLASGVLTARWLYRNIDSIFIKLGKEEAELKSWVRQFHHPSVSSASNTRRVIDSNNSDDSNDPPGDNNNSNGPGNSRAKRFFLTPLLSSPVGGRPQCLLG